ncbi:hypothetical protein BZG04_07640 [Salinivibrio kushneri]|uniref:hypothetical protein n=1 Tax=Salinivibrio kushneri TaxID=1908198 RepID=UPI0009892C7E|nr:hypothetical protein [Salinivibrio kushneri]OOE35980.1 hypothetical protein BZG04_07640 [Salinivibrio kushneri]
MNLIKYIITGAEVLVLIAALIVGALWIQEPEASYEPFLVFLSFLLPVLEIFRRKFSSTEELDDDRANKEYPRRYLDQPHQCHFINNLPNLKKVVEQSSQELWDSGVTANMRQGNYDLIHSLQDYWVKLAEFFPPMHFDGKEPRKYISEYTKSRFAFHRANFEPDGPGKGGSIVHVMVGGDVIADLEKMIEETVCTLSLNSDAIDFTEWKKQWRGKA